MRVATAISTWLVVGAALAVPGILALIVSSAAQAQVVPFNGHYYEFIQLNDDISWTDARAAALSRTFEGKSGYLVNITSAEENAFVLSLTPAPWQRLCRNFQF